MARVSFLKQALIRYFTVTNESFDDIETRVIRIELAVQDVNQLLSRLLHEIQGLREDLARSNETSNERIRELERRVNQ